MQKDSCYYHPQKVAVEICQRCHRTLCLADIRRPEYQEGTSPSSKLKEQVAFCPICNYEIRQPIGDKDNFSKKNKNSFLPVIGIALLFPVAFLFAFFSLVRGTSSGGVFGGLITFFLVIFGYFVLVVIIILRYSKQTHTNRTGSSFMASSLAQNNPLRTDYEQFLIGVNNQEFGNTYQQESYLSCFECGAKIYPDMQFCENCGDSTADEFQFAKKTGKKY